MNKGRLEAFSDGVFAIIITIMVLDLRVPAAPSLEALRSTLPVFLSYVLSFVYVGIYWNNHHHLLQASEHVSGAILWANLHLLFWLSLAPFATRWLGENYNAPWPIALYGLMLLFAGLAYFILTRALVAHHGASSRLALSIGKDRKGLASVLIYLIAIPLAFVWPWAAGGCYVFVAIMWLVPDRRIETTKGQREWRATVDTFRTFLANECLSQEALEPGKFPILKARSPYRSRLSPAPVQAGHISNTCHATPSGPTTNHIAAPLPIESSAKGKG
jgi:uncharacterized membrane protein